MQIKDVKDMFKLVECRKSQVKIINAWYWTFQSLLSDNVQVKVTTYGDGILPLYKDEEKNEEEAWKELEKTICVFVNASV
jgi:hypothetical protein